MGLRRLHALLVLVPALVASAPRSQAAGKNEASAEPTRILIPGVRSLTITGQYRVRYENRLDYDFDAGNGAGDDFFTQRVRLAFLVEFNDDISAFIQLQDAREWGEEKSLVEDDADGLDLHQGWVRVAGLPGIGGAGKIGRQTVDFGEERLISSLEWLSQGRAFDGVRHTWGDADGGSLDAFFFQTRELLNAIDDDALFLGLYGSFHPADGTVADGYALFLNDDGVAPGDTEHRLTLGTRWLHRTGDLEFGTELATQVGEVKAADVPLGETAAVHAHATWRQAATDWAPWTKLEFNFATGDDPGTADNERFNGLFPLGHAHWGYMDLAEWENLLHFMVAAGGAPAAGTGLGVYWHFFRADEGTDFFGGPNGALSTGAPGRSRTMGNEFDLKFTWAFDTAPLQSSLEVGYGIFLPGPAVRAAAGDDDPAHFVYLQGDFRF